MTKTTTRWALAVLVCFVAAWPLSGAGTTARPEEVGLSSERLQQVNALVKRHLDNKSFSGAVTLVARHGRVAHFEAQGLMDIESRKPMQKDAIFRIMSMTKPIVGASIMMMIEEGKVRLTDPVSKFIPELKDLKVAVTMPAPAAQTAAPGTPARFYTVPAEREITIRDLLTHTSGLVSGGEVRLNGEDVLKFDKARLKAYRWREVSFVFQSAMNALNPVIPISEQIIDVIETHEPDLGKEGARKRAIA